VLQETFSHASLADLSQLGLEFGKSQEFALGKFNWANRLLWKEACSEDLPP
jgi:hypothetical protein